MPKESEKAGTIQLDRLFTGTATATFALELLSLLVFIGALVAHLLVITGIWDLIKYNVDIIIFLLLVGGALSFAIFMAFFGFFTRFHSRVKGFVIGGGIGRVVATSREGQAILTMFAFSVVFFFAAAGYGFWLLWKYWINPIFSIGSRYAPIALGALGIIVVCLLAQLSSAAVSRYAAGVVSRLSEREG